MTTPPRDIQDNNQEPVPSIYYTVDLVVPEPGVAKTAHSIMI